MKLRKTLCVMVALIILATCTLSGCGDKKTANVSNENDNKVTYWVQLVSAVSQTLSSLNETPYAKELEKRTGIDVEYIHPPLGQEQEKFNLLIASNNMPDIIFWNWNSHYTGGPGKAIREKRIIPLNNYEKSAPNFFNYIKSDKEIEKMSKTDSGDYYGFTSIKSDKTLTVTDGLILRKDWLDDLGLSVPETIEEWDVVLKAFKDKKGATAPISTRSWGLPPFASAYDIKDTYYQENGKVKYGPLEPNYKDYLAKLNQWYNEGLIDKDIATIDDMTVNSNILTGVSGVTYNSIGGGIGRYMNAATEPGYDLIGAPYPVSKKGELPEYAGCVAMVPGSAAAITTNCDNVETALKLLDFGYSEEGRMFMNFGVEGETYEMIDGYPTYTELITNNSEGLSLAETLGRYTQASVSAPTVQDARYMDQYAALPSQKKTRENWTNHDSLKTLYPPVNPKDEDLNEYTRLKTDINTYKSEMFMKFVLGVESIENYDNFVAGLKTRGIDRLLELMQEALDAYNAR